MERRIIVYAEDNGGMRSITSDVLTRLGYDVHPHANGRQALEEARVLSRQGRDFWLLTDNEMPVMDGMGLLRALSDEGIRVPTVMLTATQHIDDVLKVAKLRDRVDVLLSKPFGINEMEAGLRKLADAYGQQVAIADRPRAGGYGGVPPRL